MSGKRFSKNNHLSRRHGGILGVLAGGLVAVAALGGAMYFAFFRATDEVVVDAILKEVTRGEFVAKVLDQGEVQSAENQEIKCNVGSRNGEVTVIDVVPEGTRVNGGDWLVTLDSEAFEKELEQQRVAVSNAETQVIQAKATYDAAVASRKEYIEGTFKEQKRTIENALFEARQNLDEAKAYLEHSIKLQAKNFITKQQLATDRVAVDKFQNSYELEEQRLQVLVDITQKKELILLDSDIAAAEVQVKNSEEAYRIEQRNLKEIEKQLAYCNVTVPEGVSGEVVYNKEFDRRGGSEWVLEPGAAVRERQVLIKLPNPDKMEVKVLINEQSITAIRPNMPATISVDALPNKTLTGYVTKVNSYAEQGGWGRNSSVREYAVFVRILEPPAELIPGMNASVTIQTEYQESVVQCPLQCIYAANNTNFVLRQIGEEEYETVEVTIAGENSQNVWIESGVEEGDMLVMAPGQWKELMDLPEQETESRIVLPEGTGNALTSNESSKPEVASSQTGPGRRGGPGGRRGAGGGRGGPGGFSMPKDGASFIAEKDTDSDGKLSKDEVGEPYSYFFDRIDQDSDGLLSKQEADKAIRDMKRRMQQAGGGGGGRPGS